MAKKDKIVKKRRLDRASALKAAYAAARPAVGEAAAAVAAASQAATDYIAPLFEQGADIDTLYRYSGLLGDLKTFFEKYGINSVIQDKIFYASIKNLIELYGNDDVYEYKEIIIHTLKASRSVIEALITEIKALLTDSEKVDPEKMDELLGILYRDMILNVDPDIDPAAKIQDLKGEGFKAVAKAQADPSIASKKEINRLVAEIKRKKDKMTKGELSRAEQSTIETLRMQIDTLISQLSTLIGTPGTEMESVMALEEIPELSDPLEPEPEPEPELEAPELASPEIRSRKKKTKRRKSSKKKKNKKKTKRRKKK
tara:strand:+ start:2395 stop:3333 length:939 start_codon:yes stop_codon:yes gene_type:complete